MNKILRKSMVALMLSSMAFTNQSCLEETLPTSYASGDQISNSDNAQDGLLRGLTSYMTAYDTYGVEGMGVDWGYPCQMIIRDCLTEDFPVMITGSNYDYFIDPEETTYIPTYSTYNYFYYTQLIHNASSIVKSCDVEDATEETLQNAGIAYAYRALAYLDLARMFEFRKTGYGELDAKASEVWGLTVPIVTDKTGLMESKSNPRAPFYTMYRFILSDLDKAEDRLEGYSRPTQETPDVSVVYGLKARFWLELASRFDQSPDDLTAQLAHEADEDGYQSLGIQTAADCYAKASEYAQKVIAAGYTPVTRAQWYDTSTGFNTANQAWVWMMKIGSKEQLNSWWYTWMGTLNNETEFSLGQYGTFRGISKELFDEMPAADWRRKTWVAPEDEGASTVPAGYSTLLTDAQWGDLPAYTNLKFHPGSGNLTDEYVCLLCDIPLMRVEEMYFINIEAMAHTQGLGAACSALESFVNGYRYTDGSYRCEASDMDSFIRELMVQKRIELWAEGLVYFDYKRLSLAITRDYEGTNFYKNTRLNSKEGYVAPWLNYYLPEYENAYNPAAILNPDPSQVVKDTSKYE